MNNFALALLTLVLLVLQSAAVPRMDIGGARANLLLVFVVFLGLYARRQQAVIAGLAIGLAADLLTIEQLGLLTASYGLAAAMVVSMREYLFRYRTTTQFVLTLFVSAALNVCWLAYRRAAYGAVEVWYESFLAMASSLYTAAWAPIMDATLLRAAGLIGMQRQRPRFR